MRITPHKFRHNGNDIRLTGHLQMRTTAPAGAVVNCHKALMI
jgi:hypothetical protein